MTKSQRLLQNKRYLTIHAYLSHDKTGSSLEQSAIEMTFQFSDVGETGKEPSIGITSSGCIFFIAMEKVMRSCDYGEAWEETQDPIQCSPTTSDPYGWVDPITDRIFNVQMIGLETSWICWSDDDGQSWLGNPHDSGTTPINDHIKLASGPWTSAGYGVIGQFTSGPIYETAVYYCYNKLAGIFCFTSFDGGASFEAGGQIVGLATTNGGLHGAISTAPDGTVYVTPRVETPSVIVSKDNGFTWFERTMGEDVGFYLIRVKTLRYQPIQHLTLITFGQVEMKEFTCPALLILVKLGNKKVFAFHQSKLSHLYFLKPMLETQAELQ